MKLSTLAIISSLISAAMATDEPSLRGVVSSSSASFEDQVVVAQQPNCSVKDDACSPRLKSVQCCEGLKCDGVSAKCEEVPTESEEATNA